jgi:hypothetical protein
MKIFISHIQEEFQVALVLKKWIELAFPDHCEVMVSTNPENIPTVSRYLEKNEQAFLDVKAVIILCSPVSIQTPWIPFEAGCAWMRKINIIPVCHGGLPPAELPQPLAVFQGFDLNQKDFGQKLFFILSQELGVSKLPAIQYREMREEIKQIQESIHPEASYFPPDRGQESKADQPLESLHVQVLLVLADGHGYTSAVLGEHFRMEEKKMIPLLKTLIQQNYVYASPAGMGHVRYNLTNAGKSYLEQNGLI